VLAAVSCIECWQLFPVLSVGMAAASWSECCQLFPVLSLGSGFLYQVLAPVSVLNIGSFFVLSVGSCMLRVTKHLAAVSCTECWQLFPVLSVGIYSDAEHWQLFPVLNVGNCFLYCLLAAVSCIEYWQLFPVLSVGSCFLYFILAAVSCTECWQLFPQERAGRVSQPGSTAATGRISAWVRGKALGVRDKKDQGAVKIYDL